MKPKMLTLLLLASLGLAAQEPVLHWKVDNPQVINQGNQAALQFDVVISCSEPFTYASDLMLYFKCDTAAFGTNIVASGGLTYEKLTLLQANVGGQMVYNLYGPSGNDTAVGFMVEMSLMGPPPYGWDIPQYPLNIGLLRVQMKIQDTTQTAGVKFCENIMNGTQYYIDATHPIATKYGIPPDYACIYDNDLLGFPLQPPPNPDLYWRFANYSVQNDTLYFDVQMKSSQQGTFHQEIHLAFDFNPEVFGHPVINNNRFYHERLELLYGEIAGTPLYNVYSSGNQPATTNIMMSVSTFAFGSPVYMNEVDTIWKGYASFKAKILDPSNPNWGIFFNEEEMNGVQTYVDVNQYNGVYGCPPGFECIYINNLGGFVPCSELKGQVHDAVSGAPVQNAHIFTGNFGCYSDLNGDYSFRLPCGNLDVTADGFCHFPETMNLTINNIPVTVQDFSLSPDQNGTGLVYGLVRNNNQQPVENALVQVGDSTCLTDSTGYYFLELVSGIYNLTVTAINFNPYYGTVDLDCAEFLNVPVILDSVSTTGTLSGVISNCLTGNGIGGINVVLGPYSTITGATGTYTIDSILPGQYQLIMANPIYLNTPVVIDIWIVAGQTAIADTCLLPLYSVDLYYYINCDTVLLYWHDPAGSLATGYRVEDNMLPVCTITDTFCLLTGQQGQHFYCVMALFQGKESFPACIQTLMEPCSPPSNLINYHTGFSLEVPLQWNAPLYEPNAGAVIKSALTLQGYNIYRNMWDGSGYEFLDDTPPGITYYTDNLPWYPDSASYYVTALYTSGESLPSNETWVSFSLGTNEQRNYGLKVYPNPVKNILVIESGAKITSWVMVDAMGTVRLKSGKILTDNLFIPVATLPEGVYYLGIITLEGNISRKVVVTKN